MGSSFPLTWCFLHRHCHLCWGLICLCRPVFWVLYLEIMFTQYLHSGVSNTALKYGINPQKWFSATETNGDLIDYITEEWAEVSGGGEKSTANKMKVLSFLFPQISFSAAPALKDCSRGPFSAVILNWVTSHPFLQHLPLKFQWFFTDVCRVVSSFFHSMCDPLKAGLSRPHLSLQSQTKKLSQRQLRLAN